MLWSSIVTGLAAFVSTTTAVTIFTPPLYYKNPRVSYARALVLKDGTFLVTSENYGGSPAYMPIWESTDGGYNWIEKSRVTDTTSDKWDLQYHPTLLELPAPLGQFPAGAIVFSGTAVPPDGSHTKLHAFVSTDKGLTWEHTSVIAEGGVAQENGGTPVWHPFFFFHEGKLICFYSDHRDPAYASKVVQATTSDLYGWSDPTRQVAYEDKSLHPTISTVTQIGDKVGVSEGKPVHQYLMTYEYGGAKEDPFAVYYKISEDPTDFDSVPGVPLQGPTGEYASAAPYAAFLSGGSTPDSGAVVISSSNQVDLYINRKPDASGLWETLSSNTPKAYARCVVPINSEQILVVGAGQLQPGDDINSLTANIVDINPKSSKGNSDKMAKRFIA